MLGPGNSEMTKSRARVRLQGIVIRHVTEREVGEVTVRKEGRPHGLGSRDASLKS